MSRYIDADKFFAEINKIVPCDYGTIDSYEAHNAVRDVLCDILDKLEEQPTADVQEVKHGHWIDKGVLENYPRPDINVYHLLWCSECGALHRVRPYCEGGWINASYCLNCGAKMD